ncbi:MAG: bifunctional adenosylcobinamide kinase/adenosylcobinamide-phosphate guanylyltransferase [Deltaproteobacteria bacterium]|nr:bifunctional adenosylcobinamide kinase/adenosylcobinamide-phosphate guanylyltransferase [Deltaproteobacteria bacterium]
MTRQIVFVTGGARSGKSRFAQTLVEGWQGPLLYIATGEARDAEMRGRIEKHRQDRGDRWGTLEEPLDLPRALEGAAAFGGALLDCLTLWTSNVIEAAGDEAPVFDRRVAEFLSALEAHPGRLCLVTNEVGLGIVPENALARRFRDLAGRINQQVAARATEAYLVVAGLPLRLK